MIVSDITASEPCGVLANIIWCRCREVVIYFKFRENWSQGLGAVGGRNLPSPIDLAHGLYNIWHVGWHQQVKCDYFYAVDHAVLTWQGGWNEIGVC